MNKRNFKLWRKQRGRCYYCGGQMASKRDQPNSITMDHVIPRSLGGWRDKQNSVGCCYSCNQSKGSMSPSVFAPGRGLPVIRVPNSKE